MVQLQRRKLVKHNVK